ncbi:hypothetical protein Leryth_017690 [Lithospermum erythrorhizon]|nr:hypothetical protein Leryth_017690 [Lithospermum erythrorhizon]
MSTIDSSIKWILKEHRGGRPVSRAIRLAFCCVVYTIWLARNAWAHDREEVSPDSIISKVKLATYRVLLRSFPHCRGISSFGCILSRAVLSGSGLNRKCNDTNVNENPKTKRKGYLVTGFTKEEASEAPVANPKPLGALAGGNAMPMPDEGTTDVPGILAPPPSIGAGAGANIDSGASFVGGSTSGGNC